MRSGRDELVAEHVSQAIDRADADFHEAARQHQIAEQAVNRLAAEWGEVAQALRLAPVTASVDEIAALLSKKAALDFLYERAQDEERRLRQLKLAALREKETRLDRWHRLNRI